MSTLEEPIDLEDLDDPICTLCGYPIEELHQQCSTPDGGECLGAAHGRDYVVTAGPGIFDTTGALPGRDRGTNDAPSPNERLS